VKKLIIDNDVKHAFNQNSHASEKIDSKPTSSYHISLAVRWRQPQEPPLKACQNTAKKLAELQAFRFCRASPFNHILSPLAQAQILDNSQVHLTPE
jgi:hypothetical protein